MANFVKFLDPPSKGNENPPKPFIFDRSIMKYHEICRFFTLFCPEHIKRIHNVTHNSQYGKAFGT